ncbi:MAG: hypothetical protein ACKVOK_11540 [Flavobacteriales bacterium]
MPNSNQTILDREDPIPSKKWFDSPMLFWLSFPVIFFGVIFKFQHWPFGNLIIVAGVAVSLLRIFVAFFKRQRNVYAWLYLIGALAVVCWIVLYMVFDLNAPWIKLLFMALFAFGFIGYLLKPSNKEGLLKEDLLKEEEEEAEEI